VTWVGILDYCYELLHIAGIGILVLPPSTGTEATTGASAGITMDLSSVSNWDPLGSSEDSLETFCFFDFLADIFT
jgi:hypothetical protein